MVTPRPLPPMRRQLRRPTTTGITIPGATTTTPATRMARTAPFSSGFLSPRMTESTVTTRRARSSAALRIIAATRSTARRIGVNTAITFRPGNAMENRVSSWWRRRNGSLLPGMTTLRRFRTGTILLLTTGRGLRILPPAARKPGIQNTARRRIIHRDALTQMSAPLRSPRRFRRASQPSLPVFPRRQRGKTRRPSGTPLRLFHTRLRRLRLPVRTPTPIPRRTTGTASSHLPWWSSTTGISRMAISTCCSSPPIRTRTPWIPSCAKPGCHGPGR
jgi:hypothetical protein